MAYKNLLNVNVTSKKEVFSRWRDFICARNGTYDYSTTGIGWTLFDSSYAVDEDNPQLNDWCVFYSPGEGGDDDMYIRMSWASSYMNFHLFQAWDPTTHTGANQVNTSTTLAQVSDTTSNSYLWVYGNLDYILPIFDKDVTYSYPTIMGRALPIYPGLTGVAGISASSLTAGSGVSVTLDAIPSHWFIGMDVYVRTTHTNDNSTVKIEKSTIITLSGNIITVDLVNSYTTGCKFSDHVGLFAQNSTISYSTVVSLILPDGTLIQSTPMLITPNLPVSNYDPESFSDFVGIYQTLLTHASGCPGYLDKYCKTGTFNAFYTIHDLLLEVDGTKWRCHKFYSNLYFAILEV